MKHSLMVAATVCSNETLIGVYSDIFDAIPFREFIHQGPGMEHLPIRHRSTQKKDHLHEGTMVITFSFGHWGALNWTDLHFAMGINRIKWTCLVMSEYAVCTGPFFGIHYDHPGIFGRCLTRSEIFRYSAATLR